MDTKFRKTDRYNQYNIETKDVWALFELNVWAGTAFKYLDRHDYKDDREADLNKVIYYMTEAVQRLKFAAIAHDKVVTVYSHEHFIDSKSLEYIQDYFVLEGKPRKFVVDRDQLIDLVTRDRAEAEQSNFYAPAILLILKGHYQTALDVLKLLMVSDGVTIYDQ